jgi:hypothetical protein
VATLAAWVLAAVTRGVDRATWALIRRRLGWALTHPRWFGVKVGLVAFLFIPLEAMHA